MSSFFRRSTLTWPFSIEHVGVTLDDLIQFFVVVQKADHQIIHNQQGRGADNHAADRIVVTDDGVLDGVGKSQQDDQIKGI